MVCVWIRIGLGNCGRWLPRVRAGYQTKHNAQKPKHTKGDCQGFPDHLRKMLCCSYDVKGTGWWLGWERESANPPPPTLRQDGWTRKGFCHGGAEQDAGEAPIANALARGPQAREKHEARCFFHASYGEQERMNTRPGALQFENE
jgi:hypothetical protein